MGFFEYALVEFEPAEFTIEVRGGVEGHEGIISENDKQD